MDKFFNTAGPCRPDLHYMLPPERRLRDADRLIERQEYFVLHAPRQTGKTTAFQEFYREHSEAWLARFEFQEAGPHLMLMAFLQRIVNAGGTVQREFAIGSGRADVVVRWGSHVYVIELKIRSSEDTEAKGITQLAKYLERFRVDEGYLVIFDRRQKVGWEEKIFDRITAQEGKRIHVFGA